MQITDKNGFKKLIDLDVNPIKLLKVFLCNSTKTQPKFNCTQCLNRYRILPHVKLTHSFKCLTGHLSNYKKNQISYNDSYSILQLHFKYFHIPKIAPPLRLKSLPLTHSYIV